VLAIVAAGCSSSGGDKGTDSTQGSGGTGAGGAGVQAASGNPIKVFFFNQEGASANASSPESSEAARAATDYVNKELGGINGRPIKLIHCATLGTPASVTNCANQAVDAKVDVVIKGVEVAGGSAIPILSGAGIPYVTLNAGEPVEVNHKFAYSLTAGYTAQFAPLAPYSKDKGYKKIGVIYTNVSALSAPLEGPVKKLVTKSGIDYYTDPVDISVGDLTPAYSALLAKHVDAILVVAAQGQCAAALKARASLADTTPLLMSSSCSVASVLKTVSPATTDGTVFAMLDTSSVPDDPDTKDYLAAMKKYQPKSELGAFSASSFAAIMDFYRAMKTVQDPSTLNAATIASTLDASKDVPLFMGGGEKFGCASDFFPTQPSVCAGAAFLVSYSNGDYKLAGAYNAAELLKGVS
jgi:branched-chain amino acid transport system substrate-binding protein